MGDNLPVIEWVAIRQSPEREFTWTARGALIAPDLQSALRAARMMGADDVLRADAIEAFGGWAVGSKERAFEHVAALRLDSAITAARDRNPLRGALLGVPREFDPEQGRGDFN